MTTPTSDESTSFSELDQRFMRLALALGRRGLGNTWPNPAVGAVVVKDGTILGRGWTQPGGRPHAETEALKRAGRAARGATLYVTLEPCSHHGKTPPCVDAILRADIKRVVSACGDPNVEVAGQGYAKLREAGVIVEEGLCADEARRDHAGHIRRMKDGRPHVMLKLAVSADGKAGAPGRKPLPITGEDARTRVHLMRAQADGIMVGLGTVLADNPVLNCRLPGLEERSPVRVILDAGLRTPLASSVIGTARAVQTWVVCAFEASNIGEDILRAKGVDVIRVSSEAGRLDLPQVLAKLSERGITRLMVEGGPTVAAALVAADLVDEAALFHSPQSVGEGIDALEGLPLSALTQSERLERVASETIGADTLDTYERG